MEYTPLEEETSEYLLSLHHVRTQPGGVAIASLGREISSELYPAVILISDFQTPEL